MARSACQAGIAAAMSALRRGSSPMPNPSRTTRTTGRNGDAHRAGGGGGRGADDRGELVDPQRRAADERPVDVPLGEDGGRVVGGDAAAVEDGDPVRLVAELLAQISRIRAAAACASSGDAAMPVPIAQTGS